MVDKRAEQLAQIEEMVGPFLGGGFAGGGWVPPRFGAFVRDGRRFITIAKAEGWPDLVLAVNLDGFNADLGGHVVVLTDRPNADEVAAGAQSIAAEAVGDFLQWCVKGEDDD